jgi:replicative DNA helicase
MPGMEQSFPSLTEVLARAEDRLRAGAHAATRIWPTGFGLLDRHLGGGFRSGELVLLGGPQGLGKTTWALQVARNVALSGRSVLYCTFEHDPSSLLVRLVALEAGLGGGLEAPRVDRVRAAFDTGAPGHTLEERLDESGAKALETVRGYAERLVMHRSTGTSTTLEVIARGVEAVRERTGALPILVVDYLQKVKVPAGAPTEDERVTVVVEGLKDLALDVDIPVLAIVAADKAGLAAGKRIRVTHLRGSSALAYEADTVLILNDKFDIVSRHHLMYDMGNTERFKRWVVLSIEKNRNGRDGIDLQFQKRFEQGRFDPDGEAVGEQLVDERVFTE